MRARFARYRVEVLLALALLVPVVLPRSVGAGALIGSLLGLLPPAGADVKPKSETERWKEAYMDLLRENSQLRHRLLALGKPANLVPLDPTYFARRPLRVEARVLARDASPYRGSVVLDAGSREAVTTGSPVLVGRVLVGVVSEVGPLTSRVRLVSDPGTRIWARVLSGKKEAAGYVAGTGDTSLDMRLVPAGRAKKEDPVFTGPGSSDVPTGLLIGTVARATDVDRNGVAEIEVKPAVDLNHLGIVNVLVQK